jgi:hypothetical protein
VKWPFRSKYVLVSLVRTIRFEFHMLLIERWWFGKQNRKRNLVRILSSWRAYDKLCKDSITPKNQYILSLELNYKIMYERYMDFTICFKNIKILEIQFWAIDNYNFFQIKLFHHSTTNYPFKAVINSWMQFEMYAKPLKSGGQFQVQFFKKNKSNFDRKNKTQFWF